MGRTIPSYRLASEKERRKWKIFREELNRSVITPNTNVYNF